MGRLTRLAALMAMMAALVVFPLGSTRARADAGGDELAFVSAINQVRAAHGVAPLQVDPRLTTLARWWSGQMSGADHLSHNPALATMFPVGWSKIGENVGTGPSTVALEQAFEHSPEHLANMVDPTYTSIGLGVVWNGNVEWVSEEYMAGGPPAPQSTVPASGLARAVIGAPDGHGYWEAAVDGSVWAFGSAPFLGSMAGQALSKPIVGMASTPTGQGYWLVASDGGIFAYGDAPFHGSTGAIALAKPIVAMASTTTGQGYWMVASDGGVFSFGNAGFFGSLGGRALPAPVASMSPCSNAGGYWMLGGDGSIYSFGSAPYYGSQSTA